MHYLQNGEAIGATRELISEHFPLQESFEVYMDQRYIWISGTYGSVVHIVS